MPAERYKTALQVGKETTAGTSVPATRVLYTTDIAFRDETPVTVRRVATGGRDNVRQGVVGSAVVTGSATMELDANEILEIFLLGIKGGITPTTPGGATNARLWTFVPGDLDSATFEWFDGMRGWDAAGVRVNSWTLTGDVMAGTSEVSVEFFAQSLTQATITGSLAQRTPTNIRAWAAQIAIDALGDTPGTTDFDCAVTNYAVTFNNQLSRVYAANNSRAACAVNPGELDITLELTVRASDAVSLAEFANFVAGTNRLVQLKLGHNRTIDAGVPNYEFVNLTIPSFWTAVDLGADSQGERAYVLTGNYIYDSVLGAGFKAEVQTARTAAY